ncbi:MAG: hypothetical protein Q9160_006480 [Pyrenula sp. 1 TL-2023]
MDGSTNNSRIHGRARGHSTATEDHVTSRVDGREDGSKLSGSSEDPSSSESLEMDAMDSDKDSDNGIEVDEETGLTSKERRKAHKLPLDVRIGGSGGGGGDPTMTREEKRLADQNVIKKLLANAALIGSWYLFSVAISIYNKEMFSRDKIDFHFPLFATSLHMLVQFGLASLILYLFPRFRPSPPPPSSSPYPTTTAEPSQRQTPLMTPLFYLTRLLPCGTATSLDIGLGNMSLKFITLTFYTMCKSSSLAFVLIFAFLFRLESPSWTLILIITCMTLGVVMMVFGEAAFSLAGFLLVLAASMFSGFRWALTQILLLRHPATSNPFSTMWFLTPIMFTTLFLLSLLAEGPLSILDGLSSLTSTRGVAPGILILLAPGCIAFCMIASEFALLRRTNVVTLSICGIFKEVLTITAAEVRYRDPLTPINLSGLVVTLVSIGAYNWVKVGKMRRKAREEVVVQSAGGMGGGEGGVGEGFHGEAEREGLVGGEESRNAGEMDVDDRGRERQRGRGRDER